MRLSFCQQGGVSVSGPMFLRGGGSVSRGSQSMASQSIGFSVWGLCPGGLCRETTPESEKQTVHMLLECFLVSNISVRELQFKCILTIYVDQAMVFILSHTLRL